MIRVGRRTLDVRKALEIVRGYPKGIVLLYDLADDPEARATGSDGIGLVDVGRLAALGVRLTPECIVGMLDVARLLRWERLGDEPFLEDAEPSSPLFEAMRLVEEQLRTESGVDVRTASALLHLKRPHLFPLLEESAKTELAWTAVREDMLANEEAMIELTLAIAADPELDLFTRVTNLRLYDILGAAR